jgi:hypothetical protein
MLRESSGSAALADARLLIARFLGSTPGGTTRQRGETNQWPDLGGSRRSGRVADGRFVRKWRIAGTGVIAGRLLLALPSIFSFVPDDRDAMAARQNGDELQLSA